MFYVYIVTMITYDDKGQRTPLNDEVFKGVHCTHRGAREMLEEEFPMGHFRVGDPDHYYVTFSDDVDRIVYEIQQLHLLNGE